MASNAMQDRPVQRRNTRQRQLVLDAVRSRNDHPTAEDIYTAIHGIDPRVSRGTVYRNLNLLREAGVITTVKAKGALRFDWRVDGHAHAVCRTCGAIGDIALPYDRDLDREAAEATGFSIDMHRVVFEGLCPACQAANPHQGE